MSHSDHPHLECGPKLRQEKNWLRGLDSNQDSRLQRPMCYQLHHPGVASWVRRRSAYLNGGELESLAQFVALESENCPSSEHTKVFEPSHVSIHFPKKRGIRPPAA